VAMLHRRLFAIGAVVFSVFTASAATQVKNGCVPQTNQQLIIYRAGSLTRAFEPLKQAFTCQTGIQVTDVALGSVDAARQITAGGQKADIYAAADYLDIDLLMKPAGYAEFNIEFARGRMVLAYSAIGLAAKRLPTPKATGNWYEILTMPGVTIGGGHPFLDPGAYRGPMIFQLAEAFYKVPNLYNNLLKHEVITGADPTDFQFTYEHIARATARTNPDYRYVELPDEINLSDSSRDGFYRKNAVVAIPGLGTPQSARTVMIPGTHVGWGVTILKDAANKESAIKFLQLLLGPAGTELLRENGPDPLSPARMSGKVPQALRPYASKSGK
jgi:molybdate/tungstate transport system substrate-binding protein